MEKTLSINSTYVPCVWNCCNSFAYIKNPLFSKYFCSITQNNDINNVCIFLNNIFFLRMYFDWLFNYLIQYWICIYNFCLSPHICWCIVHQSFHWNFFLLYFSIIFVNKKKILLWCIVMTSHRFYCKIKCVSQLKFSFCDIFISYLYY